MSQHHWQLAVGVAALLGLLSPAVAQEVFPPDLSSQSAPPASISKDRLGITDSTSRFGDAFDSPTSDETTVQLEGKIEGVERIAMDTDVPPRTRAGENPADDTFRTQDTSYLGFPPSRSEVLANHPPAAVDDGQIGQGEHAESPSASPNDLTSAAPKQGDPPTELPAASSLPWTTMLLFASLAANVFFYWIARDAHTKYQDLVADIGAGDARLERQSRRLRAERDYSSNEADVDGAEYLRTAEA